MLHQHLKVLQDILLHGLTNSPVAIDLDEDGDLDLVGRLNDGSDRIVWWENNGSESFLDQIDNTISVADLDEDGDYDIITADEWQ